ncbi:hypothetical protein Q0F99_06740 [Rathayibacter oskolensis]|uniref:hypothetical protein n=1 Tax=Rathayibacter oskolensis TaxID=1891671 RepID=UPI00265FE004|nr:hypothetical protein [Rathayibacter oskolensis]WKK72625.1 hypothetical protein Q0F99_06740 [Rathayibacter oskolensis]
MAGHVLRGLISSQIVDGSASSAQIADRLLYSAHLAVFTFLTGLSIQKSVEKLWHLPLLIVVLPLIAVVGP